MWKYLDALGSTGSQRNVWVEEKAKLSTEIVETFWAAFPEIFGLKCIFINWK